MAPDVPPEPEPDQQRDPPGAERPQSEREPLDESARPGSPGPPPTTPADSRSPDVHLGDPVPFRPALTAGMRREVGPGADQPLNCPPDFATETDTGNSAELRSREIVGRMPSSTHTAGQSQPGLNATPAGASQAAATSGMPAVQLSA